VRYLILSDIHANLPALEAVLADAGRVGYDEALVLGDLVGYGADPGAVIDRVLALAPRAIIRGNHDKVCAGLEPAALFNDSARQSIEWTAGVLSPDHLRMLADLPAGPLRITPELEICHGAPFDEDCYIFDERDAGRAMDAASARVCLFGHTHLPALFATADDPFTGTGDADGEAVGLPAEGPALINVGAVGQPRDGDPRAAYGVVDVDRGRLAMRRVEYDVAEAQRRIRRAGLPDWLAGRLAVGQ
jgi:diadenosine tetraphosphatase ApaH/serine/threonine PP2A family protein phosphatase